MFDFSKLGDLSKVASQAKEIHEQQELYQREQSALLRKISAQLDELLELLRKK